MQHVQPLQPRFTSDETDVDRMLTPLLQLPDVSTQQGLQELEASMGKGCVTVDPKYALKLTENYPSLRDHVVPGNSELAMGLGSLTLDEPNQNPAASEDSRGQLIYQLSARVLTRLKTAAPHFLRPSSLVPNRNARVDNDASTVGVPEEKSRPDMNICCESLMLVAGEEKRFSNQLEEAWADLRKKLDGGFPPWGYDQLPSIFVCAAAQQLFQIGICFVKSGRIHRFQRIYTLDDLRDRVLLVTAFVQIFRYLKHMLSLAPEDMRQRFNPDQTIVHNWSELTFHKLSKNTYYVLKKIKRASDFFEASGNSFEDIQAAYLAISGCEAARQAFAGPELTDNRKRKSPAKLGGQPIQTEPFTYWVKLTPVAHDLDIHRWTVDHLKKAVLACLLTLALLHPAGLVHTDIRASNIMWQGAITAFLSDFESVHRAAYKVDHPHHEDWNDATLESGSYTTSSDIHAVGVMMQKWVGTNEENQLAADGEMLMGALLGKQIAAFEATQHCYFQGVSTSSQPQL